jgi:hypothetical protein
MGISEKPVTPAPAAEPTPTPTPTPAPVTNQVQTVVTDVESSVEKRIKNWLNDIYNQNKFLFYTVIPLVGLVYLVIKYHNIIINLLIRNSKDILQQQETQDQNLANQANADKQAADNLVNQANNPPPQGPVDPDWDKK